MKLLKWYKSLTGFRKAGVVMTAIMIIVFILVRSETLSAAFN